MHRLLPEEVDKLMQKIQNLPLEDIGKSERQYYNKCILEKICLFYNIFIEDDILYYIDKYPEQRFGQIICNYICPDYRPQPYHPFTRKFMKTFFDIDIDPFFEESKDTYIRLCNANFFKR